MNTAVIYCCFGLLVVDRVVIACFTLSHPLLFILFIRYVILFIRYVCFTSLHNCPSSSPCPLSCSLFSAHQMGSCRMSASPAAGAVDPSGEYIVIMYCIVSHAVSQIVLWGLILSLAVLHRHGHSDIVFLYILTLHHPTIVTTPSYFLFFPFFLFLYR